MRTLMSRLNVTTVLLIAARYACYKKASEICMKNTHLMPAQRLLVAGARVHARDYIR